MKRLGIFAHYDAHGEVKRYILHHLSKLRPHCQRLVFVSTGKLRPDERAKAERYCDEVVMKDNVGFDFGSWKSVLEAADLSDVDELLLTNSSVFGPLEDGLDEAFQRMESDPVDIWGMTDNHELTWHLQSYFLVFRRKAIRSDAFERFWASVLPYRTKNQIIRSYEVGLTTFMCEAGFSCKALVPAHVTIPEWPASLIYQGPWRRNLTCIRPVKLIDHGMPFVKVELLRDNPNRIFLNGVRRRMQRAGYDMSMVEFDR